MTKAIVPIENIESKILTVRGQRVILDADLAAIYGVPTRRLNEQVKRNAKKFPSDFVFRLTNQEVMSNRSQFATGSQKHRDPRFLPYVFTEHGAIMAANVLNSQRMDTIDPTNAMDTIDVFFESALPRGKRRAAIQPGGDVRQNAINSRNPINSVTLRTQWTQWTL